MGMVSRHPGAPFASGEVLDGTLDLEVDIANIVAQINGNLDDSNIKSGAKVDGAKLANATITNAKLVASTITTASLAAAAVPRVAFDSASGAAAMTGSTLLVDVPDLSVTVTATSTSEVLLMDLIVTCGNASEAPVSTWLFAFSVNGTDTAVVGKLAPAALNAPTTAHIQWAMNAPVVGSFVVKPRYKHISLNASPPNFDSASVNRILRVQVVPFK